MNRSQRGDDCYMRREMDSRNGVPLLTIKGPETRITLEMVNALRDEELADLDEFDRIMGRKSGEPPRPGDEMPQD
jgi:hypothetical protein